MRNDRCTDCWRPESVLVVVETTRGSRELKCLRHVPQRDIDPRHR